MSRRGWSRTEYTDAKPGDMVTNTTDCYAYDEPLGALGNGVVRTDRTIVTSRANALVVAMTRTSLLLLLGHKLVWGWHTNWHKT